jgi:hypothetical protein
MRVTETIRDLPAEPNSDPIRQNERAIQQMRKHLLLLPAWLYGPFLFAAPQITVSASAVTLLGASQRISLIVNLVDPNNTGMLRVSGTGIVPIMTASTVSPGTTATVGPIYGNDVILDGFGNLNGTYYQVQVFTVTNGIIASTPAFQNFFAFQGAGTVDLATATPLAPSFMTGTNGSVVIPGNLTSTAGTNTINAQNINGVLWVAPNQYTTLAAALTACGSGTCWIVDMLPETFSINPFASFSGSGCKVDFGPGLWTVKAQIVFPHSCTVTGVGRGSGSPNRNTTFQAGGSFPSNTAVFRLGKGLTFDEGVRLENLTVDCNNVPGCQGVYSNSVNEQGGLFRVEIENNLGHCALFDMAGGPNFAENFKVDDFECFPTATSTSVHGIYLRGQSTFAGSGPKSITNVTVNGIGGRIIGDSVRVENVNGGMYYAIHGEKVDTVFHVASNSSLGSTNIDAHFIYGTSTTTGTNVVMIDANSSGVQLWDVVRGNGTTFTNTIQDNSSSPPTTIVGKSDFSGQFFTTEHYENGAIFVGTATTPINISDSSQLPASIPNQVWIAGGYASPVSARLVFGDNTGRQLQFSSRTASVTTDRITFIDDGSIFAGNRLNVQGSLVAYQTPNYIASEIGANNAIAGALTNVFGSNVTQAAGLCVTVKLAHTLQAGANSFALNGATAVAIKSHFNAANNIATAYAATGTIQLCYDGTEYTDMSQ